MVRRYEYSACMVRRYEHRDEDLHLHANDDSTIPTHLIVAAMSPFLLESSTEDLMFLVKGEAKVAVVLRTREFSLWFRVPSTFCPP